MDMNTLTSGNKNCTNSKLSLVEQLLESEMGDSIQRSGKEIHIKAHEIDNG